MKIGLSSSLRGVPIWIWVVGLVGVGVGVGIQGIDAVSRSRLVRPALPAEVATKYRPNGGMTMAFASAIYFKVATEDDARAMTSADIGPVQPADFRRIRESHQRFVAEAVRLGAPLDEARYGYWLATSVYRTRGNEGDLRRMVERADTPDAASSAPAGR